MSNCKVQQQETPLRSRITPKVNSDLPSLPTTLSSRKRRTRSNSEFSSQDETSVENISFRKETVKRTRKASSDDEIGSNSQQQECPDVLNMDEIDVNLQECRKTIENSFPYNTIGNVGDTYSYNRLYPHIVRFQKVLMMSCVQVITACLASPCVMALPPSRPIFQCLNHECRQAIQITSWTLLFEFLEYACNICSFLPQFDCDEHNNLRSDILHKLSAFYTLAMDSLAIESHKDSRPVISKFRNFLMDHSNTSRAFLPLIEKLDYKLGILTSEQNGK